VRTTYRRRPGSDTWHFVPTCRWWPPTNEHGERVKKPTTGELCDECISKSKARKK
jgi:hypothetical protein